MSNECPVLALSGQARRVGRCPLIGLKRTSPRDGCRSIQEHPFVCPHLFGPRLDSSMMDQQPPPCGSGCERTLCPLRGKARLDDLRTAEVGTLHVASGLPRSSSPAEPSQLIPVRPRVSPLPPVALSNGRAWRSDGEAHGHRQPAKFAEDLYLLAALQAPSPPSRRAHAPSPVLLLFLL
jgi:hypothetical protein